MVKLYTRDSYSNCPIREFTGDNVAVGRCWFYLQDGKCPRHGDVKVAVARYKDTGELTDEAGYGKNRVPTT